MILHTSNGFEYDSTKPMRVSFVLRYAGDNPKYNIFNLEYKPKNLIKTKQTFRYVENIPHGSATFLYESKVGLGKSGDVKFLEKSISNICVEESRSLESQSKLIGLNNEIKRLKTPSILIDKSSNTLGLKIEPALLLKNPLCEMLKVYPKLMEKHKNILLASSLTQINKSTWRGYSIPSRTIEIEESKEIQAIDIIKMQKVNQTQGLIIPPYRSIVIEQPKEVSDLENLKSIMINRGINVHRDNISFIDIEHLKFALDRDRLKLSNKAQEQPLQIIKSVEAGGIDKYFGPEYLYRENLHTRQDLMITRLLKRIQLKAIDKDISRILTRPNLHEMFKIISKLYRRDEIKNIVRDTTTRLITRRNIFYIFKDSFNKGSARKVQEAILKTKERYFKHIELKNIVKSTFTSLRRYRLFGMDKSQIISLIKRNPIPIYEEQPKPVNTEVIVPIDKSYSYDLIRLVHFIIEKAITKNVNRDKYLPIFIDEQKSLKPQNITTIYQSTETKFIDILKRWWIVTPGSEVDYKILPCDYDYYIHPLLGSPGVGYTRIVFPDSSDHDKVVKNMIENIKVRFYLKNHYLIPYEYLPKVYDQHPNAPDMNPYIEHDDRNRGLYELPLAINIMMEMVNLIGLIVHHQASQLCYCTGQEAMWFIMAMLDDWLNMATTLQQLTSLGATEHYHRAYRWIRWEAEKIYFNCEASNRFQGLKAAGQLLANLIAYMKNHHFDIVPMWKDLSKMDYWRNQSNKDNNPDDDSSIILDKLKGPRHLNIETQRLDKKANEGIPKK